MYTPKETKEKLYIGLGEPEQKKDEFLYNSGGGLQENPEECLMSYDKQGNARWNDTGEITIGLGEPQEEIQTNLIVKPSQVNKQMAADYENLSAESFNKMFEIAPIDPMVWEPDTYQMDGFKIHNMEVGNKSFDQASKIYLSYVFYTKEGRDLKHANEMIKNMAMAMTYMKPEGEIILQRDVYISWRQYPEITKPIPPYIKDGKTEFEGEGEKIWWRMFMSINDPRGTS